MRDRAADERGMPFRETPGRVDVALALATRAGRLLVGRRAAGLHLGGLWEFPGGKVEPGEDPPSAARRELEEETGLQALRLEPLAVLVHDYADRPLRFHAFLAPDPSGELRTDDRCQWVWMSPVEIGRLEMPAANRPILRALRWRLGPGPVAD